MDSSKTGAVIRTLRQRCGYTQKQLSDCLNVTDKAVSKWERGLSVPDISILTKLSDLLNCDVDNLLEGDITYLEKTWQGLLRTKHHTDFYIGTELFGKPLVDILLSYFLLAGIGDIYISCGEKDLAFLQNRWGNGKELGVNLFYLPEDQLPSKEANIMVVQDNPFVYGSFLTRCFQRAMSRENGVSILTLEKEKEPGESTVSFNNSREITSWEGKEKSQVCVPILFFPRRFFSNIKQCESIQKMGSLYAEPLDNGVIEYLIRDRETLLDTAFFIRYLEVRMNKRIYDMKEIASKRGFLPVQTLEDKPEVDCIMRSGRIK